MSKADLVSQQKSAILAGEDAALQSGLEGMYDAAFSEGVASVPPGGDPNKQFTQADVDAAVASAVEPLNAQIAQDQVDEQALKDAQAQLQSAKDALQAQFDALSAKEGQEAGVIAGLQGSLSQMQQVVSILQGILAPPAPQPEPAPES